MAFVVPIVKNDYDIFCSKRMRRASDSTNDKTSGSSASCVIKRGRNGPRSASGPSLSTSPGSDILVGSPAHRSLGSTPRPLGSMPRPLGSMPRSVGSMPRSLGSTPRPLGSMPRSVGSTPRSVGSTPRSRSSMPRSLGSMPRSLGSTPQQIAFHQASQQHRNGEAFLNSIRSSGSRLQSPAKSSSTSSSSAKMASSSSMKGFHTTFIDKIKRSLTSKFKDNNSSASSSKGIAGKKS